MGKIKYSINHNYFREKSLQSCYWAGFIAADGNINKNLLTLALAERDNNQLVKFNEHTESNNLIKFNNKDQFVVKRLTITSKTICQDLNFIYNITERKSLTLQPPINLINEEIDSFICGYIDGDGCICSHLNRNKRTLSISILGTKEILAFIKNRFENVINKKLNAKIRPKPETNIFEFRISSDIARSIFKYYYNLKIYKLDRKWSNKIYLECINNKRSKTVEYEKKLEEFKDLFFVKNLTVKEVMELKNLKYKNCHRYYLKAKQLNENN